MIPTTIIWLLPVFFMFHDFEEIIMMDSWKRRNAEFILRKFPRMGNKMINQYNKLSTASFALAVAIEFIVISFSAFIAAEFGIIWLWVSCFVIYSLHLIIHLIQWMIIRKYIPAIFTSVLSLFYSIYSSIILINSKILSFENFLIIILISIPTFFLFFIGIHRIAALFEIFLLKFSKNYTQIS